jgi:3-oxoacyl-[acyl-carrier protein] reductase
MNPDPRCAIVTGGARGIGRAIATRLSRDGFAVAVVDIDEQGALKVAAEIRDSGGTALAVTSDVRDEASTQAGVDRVATGLGAPTVLINNAGLTRDNLLFKMSLADWDEVMSVHLRGAFLMSRAVQQHMVAASWGRIVNLSSIAAFGNRGQSNYSAAKAGLQGLTRTLAVELGKFGITANAIAPGFIETDMTIATARRLGVSFEDFAVSVAERTPAGRVGVPADIAAAASYFVSDEAGFVTGQTLYVSGGLT